MTDIICYWSAQCKLWILTCHDADGNQIWDAQYFPNKQALSQWIRF